MFVKLFRLVCPAPEQGQPAYLHPYRMWISFWIGFAFMAVLIFPLSSAHAGVVSKWAEHFAGKVTDDPNAQEQIGNAAEALVKVLPDSGDVAHEISGGATTIRPARNISGPFEDLVVNFDKVACGAWIISYRDWMLGLMLKKDPETPPEILGKAQDLLNKVIYGCRKILDPESYPKTNGNPVTGGGGTGTTQPPPDGPGAAKIDVIDGELMISASDNICWNRCRDKWIDWKGAESMRKRAEERIREDSLRADTLESDTIPWLQRQLDSAEKALADLQAQHPHNPQQIQALNTQIVKKQTDVANLRTDVDRKRAELASLRDGVRGLQRALPGLVRDERAKLQAYLDCMHACAVQARGANSPSDFAEKTEANLKIKLQSLGAKQQEADDAAARLRIGMVTPNPRGTNEVRTVQDGSALDRFQDGILVRIDPGLPTILDNPALRPNRRGEDEEGADDGFGQTGPSMIPDTMSGHGQRPPSDNHE